MLNKKTVFVTLTVTATIFLILIGMLVFKEAPFATYSDGVYIGEAQGYRKHLKVKVILSKGYITSVEVTEHYEKGEEHYKVPIVQIPAAIIKAQSPEVDVVSGSTLTSEGIKDAVRSALEQAKQ
jgi:uncharacterized protein with FMN-binding domain